MKKGKTKTRVARHDILRSNAKNDARRARVRTLKKSYTKQAYDGHRTYSEDPLT